MKINPLHVFSSSFVESHTFSIFHLQQWKSSPRVTACVFENLPSLSFCHRRLHCEGDGESKSVCKSVGNYDGGCFVFLLSCAILPSFLPALPPQNFSLSCHKESVMSSVRGAHPSATKSHSLCRSLVEG